MPLFAANTRSSRAADRLGRQVIAALTGLATAVGLMVAVAAPATAASPAQPVGWTTNLAMSAGAVTTAAGDGTAAVKNGTGTAAQLSNPNGMSIAGTAGYFLDSGYIRKIVLSSGVVTTVVGNGSGSCGDSVTPSAVGVGYPASNVVNDGTNLYWFDSGCSNILRQMSLATSAVTTVPGSIYGTQLTVGPGGTLYAASNGTVSKVNTTTGATTVLATPTQTVDATSYGENILGMTADGTYIWISGSYNRNNSNGYFGEAVSKINPSTGAVTTIFTGSTPASPNVNGPLVSAGSYLYIDGYNQVFRLTKADGTLIGNAGSGGSGYIDGTGSNAWFAGLNSIDTDGTHLWLSDPGSHRIREITAASALPSAQSSAWTTDLNMTAGAVSTPAGDGTAAIKDGTGTAAELNNPIGTAIANGFAYFYDAGYIRKLSLSSNAVTTVSGDGSGSCSDASNPTTTQLGSPSGDITTDGSFLYWFDGQCGGGSGQGVLRRMSLATGAVSHVPGNIYGSQLTIGPGGSLFMAANGVVSKINPDTGVITALATPTQNVGGTDFTEDIRGLTADGSALWITGSYNRNPNNGYAYNAVSKIDISSGTVTTIYSDYNQTSPSINGPLVSAANYLYLSGQSEQLFRMTKASGAIIGVAGAAGYGFLDGTGAEAWLAGPTGIDSDGTHLWVADGGGHRIREVSSAAPLPSAEPTAWTTNLNMPAGAVTTAAGDGTAAVKNGTGTAAQLNNPTGMSIAGGVGYFFDNGYIRKLDLATGVVSTLSGDGTQGCSDSSSSANTAFAGPLGNVANDGRFLYWFESSGLGSCGGGGSGVLRRASLKTGAVSRVPGNIYGQSVTVGPGGAIYAVEYTSIYRINTDTGATTLLASPLDSVGTYHYNDNIRGMTADGSSIWTTAYVGCDPNSGCRYDVISKTDISTGTVTNFTNDIHTYPRINGPLVSAGNYLYLAGSGAVLRFTKADGTLSGVAGSGGYGFIDATGADAWFSGPSGIDTDGTHLWVTDGGGHRIREVTATTPLPSAEPAAWTTTLNMAAGSVSTVAGDGTAAVEDGTGTGAELSAPSGMSITGGAGYFFDSGRVRKVVLATGAVTTIAGDGTGNCSDNSTAAAAQTDGAYGNIANDGSSLYWFESSSQYSCHGELRRMSLATGAISTIPGNVYGQYLTVGPSGTLYIANNGVVSKVNPDTGAITSLVTPTQNVGGTDYTEDVRGITADATSIWVTGASSYYTGSANIYYDAISKIDIATGTVTVVYSGGSTPNVNGPLVSAGNYLYVAGYYGSQVFKLAKANGTLTSIAGSTTSGYADGYSAGALFSGIAGMDSDASGLWISDVGNHLIRRIIAAPPGGPTDTYPTPGVNPNEQPGGGNASEACACSQGQATDNPVNTSSGAFWHTFTDLATPGRGPALSISRSYVSSNAAVDSAFGYGWSSGYGLNLTVDPNNGDVTVHQEDGSEIAFAPGSTSGTFTPLQPRMLATLKQNSNATYTFIRRQRTTYTFGSGGLLKSIADLNGNTTTLTYDTNNNLTKVTDQNGRYYTVTVDGNGHITQVTDQASRSVKYGYSAAGDLTSETDPTGAKWTSTYDSNHRLLTMLDPNQQTASNPTPLTNVYDSSGRVTRQTDYAGRATTFDYTSIANSTKITSPAGNVTVDTYANGLRTQTTTGYGTSAAATTSFTYDPTTDAIVSVKDPLNHTTSYTYDGRANLLTVTDALNHTTTNTYDALDDVLTSTDPNGTKTTRTYDSRGNLTSSATPLKAADGSTTATLTTTYTHGTSSHPEDVTAIKNPNGKTTSFTRDAYGDLTAVTAPPTPENAAGNKTTYTYDNKTGWRLTQVSPRGNLSGATAANFTTSYAYDNDGRLTRLRDSLWSSGAPTQHQITTGYDVDGNTTSSTDKRGNTTTYIYDADNELTKTTLPNSTFTQQTWTADGQLKTSTDAGSHTTTYTYDPRGNQLSRKDPLNRTITYSYDVADNLTLRATPGATCTGTTPTTGCTSYTYNAVNQLTAKKYLDGATPNITGITYDPDGRRTGQTDATGTSTATYDNLGRLTTYKDGAGTVVGYAYDLDGDTTSTTYPGTSHTVTRTYDAADRLASIKDWNNNTVTFGYDANSNPTTATFPAGTSETDTTSYDNLGAVSGITDARSGTTLAGFAYTRDANSQIATATTTGISEPAQTYTHDTLSRLTASGSSSTPTNYGYSGSDDILNRGTTSGGASSTQTFDGADQLCWATTTTVASPACGTVPSGAATYNYDVNGNRKTSLSGTNTTSYGYDEDQQLTRYTPPTGSATTYTYDGDGLRQTKTTAGTTTRFTWDKTTSQLISDGANYYLYDSSGAPLEQINTASGTVTWIHHDQLESTRLLTDSTGTTVGTATYDPYGIKAAATGAVSSPLGFNGQYTDSESGLVYLRHRYYDPATAQFLTLDPLVATTGQPYSYAGDSPLDASDPSGLCSGFWGCAGSHALSIDEGFANAFTFGGVAALDEAISPGSTCTYDHDAYYGGGEAAGIAASAYLTGGVSLEVEEAEAAGEIESGIYIVNSQNGVYVGQSSQITERLAQHVRSGKFLQQEVDNAARQAVQGSRTDREVAEQLMIDRLGGIDNLLNMRNPIGVRRFNLLPQPYSR